MSVNAVLLQLRELVVTYSKTFKDPFLVNPPPWFESFVYCEVLLQFPFFFVASYAFWKGNITLNVVILYESHTVTVCTARQRVISLCLRRLAGNELLIS